MTRKIAVEVFLVSLVGLVLGLFGPFGTFEIPAGPRIAYWMVFAILGYAIFRPLIIVGRWMSDALSVSPLVGIGLALIIAAMPMALIVAMPLWQLDLISALKLGGLLRLYFQVWLIGFLVNALFMFLFKDSKDAPSVAPPPPPRPEAPEAPFLDRVTPGFGPVVALKGEDHYVRVIGETREELVLARMRDAISGLGRVEGMQIHRSWWVARDAIQSARRDGRTTILTLSNGTEVPVSRDNVASLKASGWVKGI